MSDMDMRSLLDDITGSFATLPDVLAVVLSGSQGAAFNDGHSDIDLYVYAEAEPAEGWRADLARTLGTHASIGNRFWEAGDEWIASRTGTVVDIMYRSPTWIGDQIARVLVQHQASVGYSTCFVHNVLHSRALYDRAGWYASLQAQAAQPYPEGLCRAIIAKNHPILRRTLSSYLRQLEQALMREDHVSINHRVSAMLASYFDILFAVNRLPHPGEKRQVAYVREMCPKRPADFQRQVEELLQAVAPPQHAELLTRAQSLLDGLDALLLAESLISD